MKKIKDLFNKIKQQLLSISSNTLILFIAGAIINAIIFGGICICFHPCYGGAIVSLLLTAIVACFGTTLNLKDFIRIIFGAIVAFLLILFTML